MNQKTIAGATLHTSYKNSTSFGFIMELSVSFDDFELQWGSPGA